ncbi:SLA1 homology domain 1, SHD1 [Rhizoctonia solani]|uniref:SLA1 homology domain 1, SHD1 n=1 Tax=Rhizoctonia solani TaxID=456999 RepID=A0A8H7ID58_9AGAM|nr:SLA1 homology domain 1, SHD1 [Rhizoctonia solani]
MGTHYISVWTAIYDFTPVRDDSDQLIVKKGQMLLLLDPFNDDWWRFRIKTDRHNNTDSSGFVPRGYTQEAQFVSLAIACSDYVARADGDLTISEKESLLVYAIEEDWVLVTSLKQRATGYVLRARIRIELLSTSQEAKKAVALYDYNAANPDELSFEQGEILTIINNNGEGWWHCANESRQIGLVPCNYIKSQTGSEGTESGGTLLRGTHDAVNEIQRSIDLVNQNSPSEVIEVLVTCGLKDLTFSIDLSTFSEFPDGYGDYDVYRGRLFDGTWVAVKVKVTSQQYFETSEDLTCAEICKGLSYLHTVGIVRGYKQLRARRSSNFHTTQIHGDLRSSNIYVSRDGTPLIADLGNSWLVDPYMEVKRDNLIGLPGRWASPELIKASSGPQKSSDEVMTGEEPYNEFSKARALFEVATKREPPRRPESIPHGCETGDILWALLLRCWSYEPGTRPSAIEVEESMIAIHSTLIQSRKMAAREIVSHLVARGCPEISSQLMLSSFSDYPTISEGGFSDIYQGQLLDGTVVALKVLRVSTDTIAQPKHLKASRWTHF